MNERKFQLRMARRKYKHGNWRQAVVDCGGMCIRCWSVDNLEFHEPFGEDKLGWGIFQQRLLLCHTCHDKEHSELFGENRNIQPSLLSEDVSIEILRHGGYQQWLKDFNLKDTFGRFLIYE